MPPPEGGNRRASPGRAAHLGTTPVGGLALQEVRAAPPWGTGRHATRRRPFAASSLSEDHQRRALGLPTVRAMP